MANFNELSGIKQWAATLGVAVLITVALSFTQFDDKGGAARMCRKCGGDL